MPPKKKHTKIKSGGKANASFQEASAQEISRLENTISVMIAEMDLCIDFPASSTVTSDTILQAGMLGVSHYKEMTGKQLTEDCYRLYPSPDGFQPIPFADFDEAKGFVMLILGEGEGLYAERRADHAVIDLLNHDSTSISKGAKDEQKHSKRAARAGIAKGEGEGDHLTEEMASLRLMINDLQKGQKEQGVIIHEQGNKISTLSLPRSPSHISPYLYISY